MFFRRNTMHSGKLVFQVIFSSHLIARRLLFKSKENLDKENVDKELLLKKN